MSHGGVGRGSLVGHRRSREPRRYGGLLDHRPVRGRLAGPSVVGDSSASTDDSSTEPTTTTTVPPSVLAARHLSITKDAADYTCNTKGDDRRDLRMSSAALLSARFPFISPTGGLWRCDRGDDPAGAPERRTFDVDGGALDTSGAEPLAAIWERLAPRVRDHNAQNSYCIAPRLLLLDNGYADTTVDFSSERPQELLAPAAANSLARDSEPTQPVKRPCSPSSGLSRT